VQIFRYLLFAFAFSMAVWAVVIAGGVRLISSGGPGVDKRKRCQH
jgi:hypothetical protein